jgi:hypothetical protein
VCVCVCEQCTRQAPPALSGVQVSLGFAAVHASILALVLLRLVFAAVGAGPARTSKKQREEVLRMTAFHEAGHTLTALLTKHASTLHKVTILPRGMSGGAVRGLGRPPHYPALPPPLNATTRAWSWSVAWAPWHFTVAVQLLLLVCTLVVFLLLHRAFFVVFQTHFLPDHRDEGYETRAQILAQIGVLWPAQ